MFTVSFAYFMFASDVTWKLKNEIPIVIRLLNIALVRIPTIMSPQNAAGPPTAGDLVEAIQL